MAVKIDVKCMKEELDKDKRDVSDLWNDALKNYKGIVGVSLQPKFAGVDEMIKFGTEQMNAFHRFRHNEKKVDKLRSLFISNMDYIQKGAQQLIAAATPAFPPAAAIGTALTYMLSACKQVSADYDVVTAFFEDMNAFLQRITILESRLPSYPAYRNCLMDVFTAVLDMCGFATKYIELGRFKKWVLNMVRGEDGDLASARKKMDTRLSRLQSATEYAILGNTEKLQVMSAELKQNDEMQTQMLEEQTKLLEAVLETQDSVRNDLKDIRKLLSVFEERRREEPGKQKNNKSGKPPTSDRVRGFFYDTIDPAHEYRNIKDTFIPDMSTWIFEEEAWNDWLAQENEKSASKLLCISGPPGAGKSHLAVSAHDRLVQLADRGGDASDCVVQFYFRETNDDTCYFLYAIHWITIQIAEQNARLCEKINIELAREDTELDVDDWQDVWNKLVKPLFSGTSGARLQIVFDGLDELAPDEHAVAYQFLELIKEPELNITVLCTTRPALVSKLEGLGSKTVQITKEKQLSDLKTLIWHHLNNDAGLKRLSRYMKQRISSRLEEKGDCLLYAEHMLKRFNATGREPLILKQLDQSMPDTLEQLYTTILADLQRKATLEQQQTLKDLFIWLTFSIRPITVSEAMSLARLLPGQLNLEEELQSQHLSRILRIADLEEAIDLSSPSRNSELQELQEQQGSTDAAYDDWNLPIKFQERSMRDFFRSAKVSEDPKSLRTPVFEAHRKIFITLSQILCGTVGDAVGDGLRTYAASCWIFHLSWMWYYGKSCRSTDDEKVALLEAVCAVLNGEGDVAKNLELQGVEYDDFGFQNTGPTMAFFATMAKELGEGRLKESVMHWAEEVAGNSKRAFVNLGKAHIRNWFGATDLKLAQRSYKYARGALALVSYCSVPVAFFVWSLPQRRRKSGRVSANSGHRLT
ncbi:hypothetical protein MPH_11481 [Macrophomina phaseolina MS6]|uniref:NACHT domain-containing protein n=1 Tax=Macrophomina phaseolina (strain MS6) TaxID=1126212 RepID=K2QNF3_MACPH|nr:hypothetical protein MPH_11481 [Macrophomina phaseolina MS6]